MKFLYRIMMDLMTSLLLMVLIDYKAVIELANMFSNIINLYQTIIKKTKIFRKGNVSHLIYVFKNI